ncbi:interleukin-20 receptor subunit beta isoform X2 [Centroberyx gerrardi]
MGARGKVSHGALLLVLLDLTNYAWFLPSPHRVSIKSVNMRHVLKWRPPQAACNATVLYSVQFQGEFELRILNGRWVDAPECQQIPHTHCDLTFDLGSDSDYNIHVRAQCGSQVSPWAQLSRPFNRRNTLLTAPEMTVTAEGDALRVSFDNLPLTAGVSVTVWKRGEELQAASYVLPAQQSVLQVAALQDGAQYCVRAHTQMDTQLRSSSTDTHCVTITGPVPDPVWNWPITVTVTVCAMAGFLFVVFWSVAHCNPEACQAYFHKDPLPRLLQPDLQIQILKIPEEAELCEPIHAVEPSDRQPAAEPAEKTIDKSSVTDGRIKLLLTSDFTE